MNVRKLDTFSGHRDCVYTLIKDKQAEQFYSAGGDGFVVRWNVNKPDLGELIVKTNGSIYALALDEQRDQLWIGQNFEGIQLVNPYTKQLITSSKITSASIFAIQLIGDTAYIGMSDGVITVMDIDSFAVKKHLKVSDKSVRALLKHPSKAHLAVGLSDWSVGIIDIESNQFLYKLEGHQNSVFAVRYSPDGSRLFSVGRDAKIKVWDVENSYALVSDIPAHMYAINDLVFSPDGRYFATASMDKSIKIWNAHTLKLVKVIDRARHAGHGTSVNKLLWIEYQSVLLSASDDKMVSVWQVEEE